MTTIPTSSAAIRIQPQQPMPPQHESFWLQESCVQFSDSVIGRGSSRACQGRVPNRMMMSGTPIVNSRRAESLSQHQEAI